MLEVVQYQILTVDLMVLHLLFQTVPLVEGYFCPLLFHEGKNRGEQRGSMPNGGGGGLDAQRQR